MTTSTPFRPHPLPRILRRTYSQFPPLTPQTSMARQYSTILTSTPPTLITLLVLIFVLSHPRTAPPTNKTTTFRRPVPPVHSNHRGILMSCPPGPADTNQGPWKPSKMTLGVEGVLRQSIRYNTTLPFFLAYYAHEEQLIIPWCQYLNNTFGNRLDITCFKIPERYPMGLYGYAKILAIRYVPLKEVLWLDCDVFPVRRFDELFEDVEFSKTGAMFWADSRDFFDETKVQTILPISARKLFPKTAWYVRQGFDSGLVLLDKQRSHKQIEELSRIAQSPQAKSLRGLSMGDKDMFHIVWMRHSKNFTLVPYIGETGSMQTRRTRGLRNIHPRKVHWVMSSQVKHGRDGSVYALHQLHKQHPLSLIATMSKDMPFFSSRVTRSTTHVKPFLSARMDLRLMKPGYRTKPKVGDFVGDLEAALTGSSGAMKQMSFEKGPINKLFGLRLEWAPNWIHAAAAEMGRVWKHGVDAESAARAIYGDNKKAILTKSDTGGYRKLIYLRQWNTSVKWDEQRRRNIRKWKKSDDDRAIRSVVEEQDG